VLQRDSPGALDQGMPEPTDPLAVIHGEIPVPCSALTHLTPTTSPALARLHPLQVVSSDHWASKSCYYCFFPRLALQSSRIASAGRGDAGATQVCPGTVLQVCLKAFFNPYMPNSF